jgi:hypothetical protein
MNSLLLVWMILTFDGLAKDDYTNKNGIHSQGNITGIFYCPNPNP